MCIYIDGPDLFREVWMEREINLEGNKGRQCEVVERKRHDLKRTMKGIK